jgi:hypothetical protein
MTFTFPFFNLLGFFNLPFSNSTQSQSQAEIVVPEFESDSSKHDFLREMIFSNQNGIQCNSELAALMALYRWQV